MKIVFAGGGSGGHLFPLVAIIREMRKKIGNQVEMHYIGPYNKRIKEVFTNEGLHLHFIFSGKLRRSWHPKDIFINIIDLLFRIPWGFIQSLFILLFMNPEFIFTKGGKGSVEVTFSSWLLQIPIFMHESDIVPGKANKIANKFSVETFISFPDTEHLPVDKLILVGNPIRELKNTQKNLSKKKKIILILGGSLGSERINDVVLSILPDMTKNFEVIHHCGDKNFQHIKKEAEFLLPDSLEKYYHPHPFLNEEQIAYAYEVADIIISRAGAGSIFEIAQAGKASILIPLPESSQNHQFKNAYAYAKTGASTVIEENNLTPHLLLGKIQHILTSPAIKEKMEQSAKMFSRPRAAEIIANYLVEYLKK